MKLVQGRPFDGSLGGYPWMSTTWHVILLALLLCLPSFGKETSEVIQELTQKVLDHQQQYVPARYLS